MVSPMEWLETLYIDGVKLEAFTTSGGLGTMCETYLGKVDNLDYKTMRYPGPCALMNFFFHELLMRERRQLAGEILTHAKPPVDDDVVYVHVSAEGTIDGALRRKEFVRAYHPDRDRGRRRTAIAWTTSASVVAVIEMVRDGKLPARGFLKQEEIPLATVPGDDHRPALRRHRSGERHRAGILHRPVRHPRSRGLCRLSRPDRGDSGAVRRPLRRARRTAAGLRGRGAFAAGRGDRVPELRSGEGLVRIRGLSEAATPRR